MWSLEWHFSHSKDRSLLFHSFEKLASSKNCHCLQCLGLFLQCDRIHFASVKLRNHNGSSSLHPNTPTSFIHSTWTHFSAPGTHTKKTAKAKTKVFLKLYNLKISHFSASKLLLAKLIRNQWVNDLYRSEVTSRRCKHWAMSRPVSTMWAAL